MEVEVALHPSSCIAPDAMKMVLASCLPHQSAMGTINPQLLNLPDEYRSAISKIRTYGTGPIKRIYCYVLNDDPSEESIVDNDGEVLSVATQTVLPSTKFDNDWDSLIYDGAEQNVKEIMKDFMNTMVMFTDHDVSSDHITCNKIVMLHGPPGTGKTTVCHGLAQKLTIQYSDRFERGIILEVNTHSLFSKWFAESGKMVKKLFDKLNTIADSNDTLVFVLIDEVESLATTRQSSMNGSDPSDAIRVVNALLTQIDQIRRRKNVILMATSNLTECIDDAFMSRADLRLFVPPPAPAARYVIFKECIDELVSKGLITPTYDLLDFKVFAAMNEEVRYTFRSSHQLMECVDLSEGMSGRELRRLPFLAFVYKRLSVPSDVNTFLDALLFSAKEQRTSQE